MALRKRNVKIKLPIAEANQIIKFTLVNWSAYQEFVVPPRSEEFTTNAQGEATANLWASADGLSKTYYRVELPSNVDKEKNPALFFNLEYGNGADIDLSNLLLADIPVSDGQPLYDFVEQELDALSAAKQDLITVYNPDKPQSPPSVYDDDFLGSTLSPSWTQFNIDSGNLTISKSLVQIKQGTSIEISTIERACPSGNYAIVAKVLNNNQDISVYPGLHIKAVDGASSTRFLFCIKNDLIAIEQWDNQTYMGEIVSYDIDRKFDQDSWFYLKVVKTASTLFNFYFSTNGIQWMEVTVSHTINPDKFGVGLSGDADNIGYFDWIKIYTGDVAIIGG